MARYTTAQVISHRPLGDQSDIESGHDQSDSDDNLVPDDDSDDYRDRETEINTDDDDMQETDSENDIEDTGNDRQERNIQELQDDMNVQEIDDARGRENGIGKGHRLWYRPRPLERGRQGRRSKGRSI